MLSLGGETKGGWKKDQKVKTEKLELCQEVECETYSVVQKVTWLRACEASLSMALTAWCGVREGRPLSAFRDLLSMICGDSLVVSFQGPFFLPLFSVCIYSSQVLGLHFSLNSWLAWICVLKHIFFLESQKGKLPLFQRCFYSVKIDFLWSWESVARARSSYFPTEWKWSTVFVCRPHHSWPLPRMRQGPLGLAWGAGSEVSEHRCAPPTFEDLAGTR